MNFVPCVRLLKQGQVCVQTLGTSIRSTVNLNTHIDCVTKVSFCSQKLNIQQILRANQKNKTLGEVSQQNKSSTSIKSTAKLPTSKTKTTLSKSQLSDTNTELGESGIVIPEWFNVILESSFTPSSQINEDQFSEFKDFVEELELEYIPSVSSIISATKTHSQTRVLDLWQSKMTRELGGAENFKKYKEGIITNGLNLHECVRAKLAGDDDFVVGEKNQGHWESVGHVLPNVCDVLAMEEDCVHPEMFYRGKVDCVATYKNTVCLIEWKTSSKPKPLLSSTYDNPMQVVAYIGAINRSRMLKRKGVPSLTTGALVIAYGDGEPATVHVMKPKVVERYWKKWSQRLYQYWTFKYRQSLQDTEKT